MGIEWEVIEPGKVLLGSDNRTVLFGGIGPKHEVKIDYRFEISKYPVKNNLSDKLILEGCEIASESEWSLAAKQQKIFGNDETEELSDRVNNSYWGKICDGRSFVSDNWIFGVGRRWEVGRCKGFQIEKNGNKSEYFRLVRNKIVLNESQKTNTLPSSPDKSKLLIEEILICFLAGIIPSFIWAYFNASPKYIYEGWLNLVFGGIFVGFFTILFWRPRTKTWLIKEM
tara:strand:+ start:1992 stop:2672 length:681 start_codon:yes stop_codon:yes gene_type:complete